MLAVVGPGVAEGINQFVGVDFEDLAGFYHGADGVGDVLVAVGCAVDVQSRFTTSSTKIQTKARTSCIK